MAVLLYLKKVRKTNKSSDSPLEFCLYEHFCQSEISNFCYVKKYRYRLHFNPYFLIHLTFYGSVKVVLINLVAIVMMPTKLVTLDPLKIKVFWFKAYDVIICVHDVIDKLLSPELYCRYNHVTKFGNSSICISIIIKSIEIGKSLISSAPREFE